MNPKKILLTVNILLTGLILWTAFSLVMTWTSAERAFDTPQDRSTKKEGKGGKPLGKVKRISDYQAVVKQDIFRSTRQKPETPAEKVEDKKIEVTQLNLKLKGVVVRKTSRSFAVILDPRTKKDEVFYVNDTLQNAKIVKILPDQVILDVNNRQEALLLFVEGEKAEGEAAKQSGRAGVRPPVKGAVTAPGAGPAAGRPPARRLPGT